MYERCVACQNRGGCSARSANTSISLNCTTNRSPRASTPSPQFYALPPRPCQPRACRRCYGYDPNPARDERCGACHTGVDCSGHLLDTFSSLKRTTNRSSRASRPRSRPRSASRAPRRPRAGLPSFGDTSDAISRQPLRVGRVDRCWCQWHGWGASWQRDKPRRAPRHTGTHVPFTVKRR